VIFDTVTDHESSYKGFLALVLIAFNNHGYIIDALALHKEMKQFASVWENPEIVKFCSRGVQNMEDVKRDWHSFGMNFFDIELL
jgi:ribonuclease D